jgi:hypothetical protein
VYCQQHFHNPDMSGLSLALIGNASGQDAQPIKKVPGRKTDVKDAEWIADLLCHGLAAFQLCSDRSMLARDRPFRSKPIVRFPTGSELAPQHCADYLR